MPTSLRLTVLLCAIQALASEMELIPSNVTVLRGDEVRFNCSTRRSWDVMVWLLSSRTVMTISALYGRLGDDVRYGAVNHSTSEKSVWEFVLWNASLSRTVQEVACDLQNIDRKTAALFVQETGSVRIVGDRPVQKGELVLLHCAAEGWFPEPAVVWIVNGKEAGGDEYNVTSIQDSAGLFHSNSTLGVRAERTTTVECQASVTALSAPQRHNITLAVVSEDNTVLIAVTTSVCVLVLLLLAVGIVVWFRTIAAKMDEQDERSLDQQDRERNSAVSDTGGRVNPGYLSEGRTDTGCNDLSGSDYRQTNPISARKIPDVVYANIRTVRSEDSHSSTGSDGVKRTRLVTTV
ncbi:immunoglobulin superfamily member 5 isoform X2 [Chanos chanos]|uniref:immunoglobulin superfamily member 5 isoform X2 n=1 Tax=Chanos chanos TaxID=29144 RepID=UPI0011F0BB55|nr:immunoglobulin superfamily member 5-like isoform X2 [Chanos chanos]